VIGHGVDNEATENSPWCRRVSTASAGAGESTNSRKRVGTSAAAGERWVVLRKECGGPSRGRATAVSNEWCPAADGQG